MPEKDDLMRMKMNTSLSGPTVNVAPGGVHVCGLAEAIRHYRAGHGTPTEDCAEEFKAALAEREAIEQADAAAEDDGIDVSTDDVDGADADEPADPPTEDAKPKRAKRAA